MSEKKINEILSKIEKINSAAGIFIRQILDIASLWDDLVDGDKKIKQEDINRVFEIMLIKLPRNSFYIDNFISLNSILSAAIQNWHIANSIERENREDLYPISFIIRSSYADLITMSAYILGGNSFACEIGREIREFVHDEGFQGYTIDLVREKELRKKLHQEREV